MTSEAVLKTGHWAWIAGFLGFQACLIAMDRWWPGSPGQTLVRIAYYSCITIWLGLKIRAGYRRRRPHWTRDSWLRYLRLAVMPVVAITLTLLLSSIDMSSNTLGAPQSPARAVAALTILAMMIFGAVGLIMAIDWLERGEPSAQFTRTRWFQRHGRRQINT